MSSDPRFSRLRSDPRFRRPRKNISKIVIDDRFKSVFAQEKKPKNKSAARVDKYGRRLSDSYEQDNLRRFYRLENGDEGGVEEPKPIDYARGQVLLESSDEEESEKEDAESDAEDGFVILGRNENEDEEEPEIDLDESEYADLSAQAAAYARDHPETEAQEGARTRRLAAVNLDWDHIRASHLFKVCSSLVSLTAPALASSSRGTEKSKKHVNATSEIVRGQVLNVRVYPSEFGKERMAREEREGPPAEVFKKKENESEEVNHRNIYEVGDENELNEDALRKYQLERLRYYYAVITCDSVDAASHIYDELEGTELERSANVFDLSFVPEDMVFDDEFRDETMEDSFATYKGLDFVTDALRHSKVKLTWDEDDPERNLVTRRTLSRKEIEDGHFNSYLASSSESEGEDERQDTAQKKSQQKAQSRDKLRALLLGGNDDLPEGWARAGDKDEGSDIDMEITFTPALSESKGDQDETTIEKYRRKMKEKRKNKAERRAKGLEPPPKGDSELGRDDFFDAASDDEPAPPQTKESVSLEELKKLADGDEGRKHFDLKAVLKAEKKSKRKDKRGKKAREQDANDETQPDFTLDVKDVRFSVLHEDPNFAIDPSNPQFKRTKSMSALLEEGGKRRQANRGENESLDKTPKKGGTGGHRNLQSLVESVKRKSSHPARRGTGKRQKVS
ncbi:uncharacterized protein BT62DRAFT_523469 [Guyanagaster necrorhizus]|uniref:NUC153 domain-containing protein n=1 Tax=Guyanagaster necrorhizus TaxID=856835 RepID=A0A9P8AWP9_9AGAR|nr:uncharacterized protein BT62DRAFT_523469 [Guyanagaster necrorhizus MCA 3950]KAG7450575.1 hypothetical protein BT62DRAFT_523469 [Guyanagaster necrorhizus MCA 3950]